MALWALWTLPKCYVFSVLMDTSCQGRRVCQLQIRWWHPESSKPCMHDPGWLMITIWQQQQWTWRRGVTHTCTLIQSVLYIFLGHSSPRFEGGKGFWAVEILEKTMISEKTKRHYHRIVQHLQKRPETWNLMCCSLCSPHRHGGTWTCTWTKKSVYLVKCVTYGHKNWREGVKHHACSGNGLLPLLALRNSLCSTFSNPDEMLMFLMSIFHRVFNLCSCPIARAAILWQMMLLKLSWAWTFRRNSLALQFLNTLLMLALKAQRSAGTMTQCQKACILIATSFAGGPFGPSQIHVVTIICIWLSSYIHKFVAVSWWG